MITPSESRRRLATPRPEPLLQGIDARVDAVMGWWKRRKRLLAQLQADAAAVDAMASECVELRDRHLQERLRGFRERLRRGGKDAEACVPQALAAIREAADRKLGLRPFPVQLMGALALHRGYLVEMATGEGKTLTAGLAAVLAGWTRRPCHVVTVNDYLVERDCQWMHPLYEYAGVQAAWVAGSMDQAERAKGYTADVTYVTSKELLADYLRDRLQVADSGGAGRLVRELLDPRASALGKLAMRGIDTCIVDEADSVLIDEAVTPLIISAPRKNELLERAVLAAREIVESLQPDVDYRKDLRYREVELSKAGRAHLAAACENLEGLWRGEERRDELIRQALVAREFFLRDQQYIIADGKIVIVDEATGRQMPQRTWRQGLHQAVEAKERLQLSDPSETIARLSFQRFFRGFRRLSGMTGTGWEAAAEFWHVYRLPVVAIPSNQPCIRERWPDVFFSNQEDKLTAVVAEIERLHATGRPILVGTRSVEASEQLAQRLQARHLAFTVLNAVRNREEAAVVALAGERGQITVATNMAGRGTDIKLGAGVAHLGGLHVLATERHPSGRVDRQLFGRAGRQGDPGSAQAFLSTDDEIVPRLLPTLGRKVLEAAVRTRLPGWRKTSESLFRTAQNRAQKEAAKQRQGVLRADTWLEESLSFTGGEGL